MCDTTARVARVRARTRQLRRRAREKRAIGALSALCIAGLAVLFRCRGRHPWWHWVYLLGGGYVLFDLLAIAAGLEAWQLLLQWMFDADNPAWNWIWGGFSGLGLLSLLLGCYLFYQKQKMKE